MNVILRSRDGFLADTYAKIGEPVPEGLVETPGYLCAESEWDADTKRPVFRVQWCGDREEATRFPTAEAAWTVFDKSGHGRRTDYQTETL